VRAHGNGCLTGPQHSCVACTPRPSASRACPADCSPALAFSLVSGHGNPDLVPLATAIPQESARIRPEASASSERDPSGCRTPCRRRISPASTNDHRLAPRCDRPVCPGRLSLLGGGYFNEQVWRIRLITNIVDDSVSNRGSGSFVDAAGPERPGPLPMVGALALPLPGKATMVAVGVSWRPSSVARTDYPAHRHRRRPAPPARRSAQPGRACSWPPAPAGDCRPPARPR
jgi:hypothetical protein